MPFNFVTGFRGVNMFIVRTSKPVKNLWKNGLFLIALVCIPQTNGLRARTDRLAVYNIILFILLYYVIIIIIIVIDYYYYYNYYYYYIIIIIIIIIILKLPPRPMLLPVCCFSVSGLIHFRHRVKWFTSNQVTWYNLIYFLLGTSCLGRLSGDVLCVRENGEQQSRSGAD